MPNIEPIGYIKTDFKDKFGVPRQGGRAPSLKGKIIFYPKYRIAEAINGLEEFSHIWLLFDFSKAHREEWSPTVRPPRLGGNKRIGVFASRSPFRPNSIGLSSVVLEKIEKTKEYGNVLIVSGVDLIDETPIYDIKPYLPYTDCHPEAKGSYGQAMKDYTLEIDFPVSILEIIPEEKRSSLIECLKDDPRPSYIDDPKRIYKMQFSDFDIHFRVSGNVLTVVKCCKNN